MRVKNSSDSTLRLDLADGTQRVVTPRAVTELAPEELHPPLRERLAKLARKDLVRVLKPQAPAPRVARAAPAPVAVPTPVPVSAPGGESPVGEPAGAEDESEFLAEGDDAAASSAGSGRRRGRRRSAED